MFGHDDNIGQDHSVAEPATDGTLTAEPSITALPPVDTITDDSDTSDAASSFVATDASGQPDTEAVSAPNVPAGNSDLLDIKQRALQQLSPLVGHLNQTPEEKFRTMMMMIQASDDQSLISQAYSAAKEIADEKTRAQALLDIINEINYFTQQHES